MDSWAEAGFRRRACAFRAFVAGSELGKLREVIGQFCPTPLRRKQSSNKDLPMKTSQPGSQVDTQKLVYSMNQIAPGFHRVGSGLEDIQSYQRTK